MLFSVSVFLMLDWMHLNTEKDKCVLHILDFCLSVDSDFMN